MTQQAGEAVRHIIDTYLACWSRADIAGLKALYSDDFQYHDLTSGTVVAAADIADFLQETFAYAARSSIVFNEIIYPNDETVFVHWKQSLKIPGKRGLVQIGGVELLVVRGGKIASVHEFYDYQPPHHGDGDSAIDTQQAEQLRKLGLQEDDVAAIGARASAYLKDTEAFLDPDISLVKIAEAIGVTRNQLSHVLNNLIDASFYDWVNTHRIAYVVERMKANDARISLISMAMEAGFNSLSGFYGAFKKQTGFTPSAYRKTLAKDG